jgi:Acetyltransferases, including N-acetylases of ribosomal proteins
MTEHDRPQLPGDLLLTDGIVRLRRWLVSDAQAVYAACQDPVIARFVPIPQPYTLDCATDFIARSRAEMDAGPSAHLAIVDAVAGRFLGAISRHGPDGHRAAFGYWLAPGARGAGNATRALRLIVDWTLATTDAIRLELYTDPGNDASGRVAQRAGFEREGARRAWDFDRDGHPVDSVFYVRVNDRRQQTQ